jgi:hypothetical protein
MFRLTDEQFAELLDACRPVPYMVIGGVVPRSPQENANAAWCSLGRKMGFDGMTVMPVPGDKMSFTAEEAAKAGGGDE